MFALNRSKRAFVALLTVVLAGCSSKQSSPPAGAPKPAADGAPAASDAGPQLVPPTKNEPQGSVVPRKAAGLVHTVAFRANTAASTMPKVALTRQEEDLCKAKVGDSMPAIELPQVESGKTTKLADLFGKNATVVVFWKSDRRMTREQLADIGPDVIEPYGKAGVAVVGIAVQESAQGAREVLTKAGAKFDNLLDADGKAFAQVGSERLPRTYVLDPTGKIVWFDIEYSLTTRRELHDVLTVLTAK